MDQSITRRGQPCWYRVEGVGNIAINDAFLLEGAIYHLLKKHFRSTPYYVDLMELFHEVRLVNLISAAFNSVFRFRHRTRPKWGSWSISSQLQRITSISPNSLLKSNLVSPFQINRLMNQYRHKFIVIYKTAFYSFYLPVALAMYMSGIKDSSSYDLAKEILIPLGEYFQVQDDYLDCFGSPEDIGKIGTDIIDNKCSWLVNVALQIATPAQRKVLDENYGRKDAACEARIKALYEELDLRQRYATYEQQSYDRVMGLINTIPLEGRRGPSDQATLKREVFKSFLDKIYKRKK